VFENRALRRIFGPKKGEIIGGCRKINNGGLHNLYCLPNTTTIISSKRITSAGKVARTKAKRNTYTVLVGKPQGKKPMGRTIHRRNDNIRMYSVI
jgi:hypothetical protein